MATEKILTFDEAGNAKRMKVRIARFLDSEPVTGADKENIRDSLGVSPDATGLVRDDIGSGAGEISVNGMLGSLAFQDADSVSMGTVEITDKIDLAGAPTQQLEVYGDAPTVRVTDMSDGVGDGASIGKLEFYGNDGSSGGVGVRAKIDTVSETAAGNQYGIALSTSTGNAAPVEQLRLSGAGQLGIGVSPDKALTVKAGTINTDVARFTGANNDRGLVISTAANGITNDASIEFDAVSASTAGQHVFKTDGTERMRLTSTGLGLGKTPGVALDVMEAGDSIKADFTNNVNANFRIKTSGANAQIGPSTASNLELQTGNTTRATIDTSGNLILQKGGGAYLQLKDASAVRGAINVGTSDGLIFTTGASFTERWRINSSGNLQANSTGIDFGSGASTTIDAYEEGTFTPVVADAVSGGNTATPGTAQGRYTRVGRIVQFSCLVANIDTTGLTAGLGLYIQGLPFPGVAVSSWKPMTVMTDTITFSGQVVGIIGQNESAIRFKQFASGGADSDLLVSAVSSGTSDIHIQGVYEVV